MCESIKELERHLEGGKHTEGLIRPPSHRAGVVAGRSTAHDRDVALARKHVEAVAATSLRTASLQPAQLQPADAFTIVFADGRACELTPVAGSWARAQRLPTERCNVEQIEFVYAAYTIGETFNEVKLSAASAHELMKVAGTAASAAQ